MVRRAFLTARECAEIMGVSLGDIYAAINQGHLKAHRERQRWNPEKRQFDGTTTPWRIMKKDFKAWVDYTSSLNDPNNQYKYGLQRLYGAIHDKPIFSHQWLADKLMELEPRKQYVIRRRFGLGCSPAMLSELSNELKVSRMMVRKIQLDAIDELREALKPSH